MRPLCWLNYMKMILNSVLPIKQAHQWKTFISRKDFFATWAIYVFLQASVRCWFGKHIAVRWHGNLAPKRQWWYCRSTFIGLSSNKMSVDISDHPLPTPSQNLSLRSRGFTTLWILLMGQRNPSPWITCQDYLQPSIVMILFMVVNHFSKMAILIA